MRLRLVLAVVFLRAGAVKVRDVAGFRQAVRNYALLPPRWVGVAARGVPVVELLAGGLLLLGVEPRVAGIIVALMLAGFCMAIAVNLLRGRTISCGCSGSVASDISWRDVITNSMLAAAAIIVALWPAQPLSMFAGVADSHASAAWMPRAIAWLLIMGCAAQAAQ